MTDHLYDDSPTATYGAALGFSGMLGILLGLLLGLDPTGTCMITVGLVLMMMWFGRREAS